MLAETIVGKIKEAGIEDSTVSPAELLGIVYGKRWEDEYLARERIIRRIVKAKRDAGFKLDCNFFDDVWPVALQALREKRARDEQP